MITYQKRFISEIKEDLLPLLEKHKEEVAVYDFFSLNVMWDVYESAEDAGDFVCYTAEDDGTIIGYVAYFISEAVHYADEVYAVMDVIFLDEAYRHSPVSRELMQYAEEELRRCFNITMLTIHMKVWLTFKQLADDLGYDLKELMYTKYVGG